MPVKANIDILANELTEGASSGFVNPLEFLRSEERRVGKECRL